MMRSNIPVPIPVDERASRAARRQEAYQLPARAADAALWSGILFWIGFAVLAVIAGL